MVWCLDSALVDGMQKITYVEKYDMAVKDNGYVKMFEDIGRFR